MSMPKCRTGCDRVLSVGRPLGVLGWSSVVEQVSGGGGGGDDDGSSSAAVAAATDKVRAMSYRTQQELPAIRRRSEQGMCNKPRHMHHTEQKVREQSCSLVWIYRCFRRSHLKQLVGSHFTDRHVQTYVLDIYMHTYVDMHSKVITRGQAGEKASARLRDLAVSP
jgi:hypothetical protein